MKTSYIFTTLLLAGLSYAQDPVTSCDGAALKYAFGADRIGSEVYENQYNSGSSIKLSVPESWEAKLVSGQTLSVESGVSSTKEVYVVTNKNFSDSTISSYTVTVMNQTKKPVGQDNKAFCSLVNISSNK